MTNTDNLAVSEQRKWFNTWVRDSAKGKVLDVGKSRFWNYGFETIDINPKLNPSIVGDICSDIVPSESYDTVLCNGMYEFVEDPQKMVDSVQRILKPAGIAIFGFVGKNYKPYRKNWKYYDNNINFGMDVVGTKTFEDYHFIICRKQNFVE